MSERIYTVYAPGAWYEDVRPAMEDREDDAVNGVLTAEQVEVVAQYWDPSRNVKRGRGSAHRFDLSSIEAVKFLREEAAYRAEFWDGPAEWFGGDKDYGAKQSAERLVARCDKILWAAWGDPRQTPLIDDWG